MPFPKLLFVLLLVSSHLTALATAPAPRPLPITRIDPTFWWVGMKNPQLQLLVHGPGIASSQVQLATYEGVTLDGFQKLESPNYLLVNLTISPTARPGKLKLEFKGAKKATYEYELRQRTTPGDKTKVQGISSADFIYLLMPDRFANGDPSNDVVKGNRAPGLARDSMYARHGGDLRGIEQHFDYLKDLGVTAIWPTPVVDNNMPRTGYHGYALTDYYQVDPHYGTNEDYVRFVQRAHQQGLKVIHDVVLNHIGSYHYLWLDQPAKDWFHQWPQFTRGNYRNGTVNDPHGAAQDRTLFSTTWFDTTMPDLAQENPLVATYLIQNFLWWVEYTGLDGYRVDTYTYSDPGFLMQWGQAILAEYPQLGMFGETWMQETEGVAQQAFWTRNVFPPVGGFKSNLPGAIDFILRQALLESLTKPTGYAEGVAKLYYAVQGDWMYEDASRNVIFLDNHDVDRVFSVLGEDVRKQKMALAWLLTERGIPQLYYGTEVLMKNFSRPDGLLREDFPGGWATDPKNAFTAAGRTPAQQDMHAYVRKLANYRKTHPVLQTGQLTHFIPEDGVYTYFRHDAQGRAVLVMLNCNATAKTVSLQRFAERLQGYTSAQDVLTDAVVPNLQTANVPAYTALVWELR
ncbi:glycoside hydrolase family 13 protein [Hymenobacter lutimineralis]|uniref:Glycoside hydrolase family 13 protein n=1 Tax=Hymenobacter lutimineralis TaxID=2606448 RepID=A0A5D6UYG4_9BACT|nr:glycoside hydrolase family 13 protein [Hymenobacter lutimineralis]TYZ07888.1 glycoside hydrolase family 13 protein [Hymenobacter lutimineralis]